MSMLDTATLAACTGAPMDRALVYAPILWPAMDAYEINLPARQAAFFAQVGHESGGLKHTVELWGTTPEQVTYERDPDTPWTLRRADGSRHRNSKAFELGNANRGDGARFRGHGLIQTTGRDNHASVRDRLRKRFPEMDVPDFEDEPLLLAAQMWAAYSACDFWDMKGLNKLADAGDFVLITRRINGGLNGYDDRLKRWNTAKRVLHVT